MKQPNLLRFPFRRGKKGSSLAMVMMIGAALVIWVMCIMPLMATTGTVSSQTQGEFNNYLDNRSAIEYCKSQLQYVAVRETPKTFVVIGDSDGTYSAITKKVGADADGSYTTYVSEGALSTKDSDDEPRNDANGQKVAALCAVELSEDATCYEITIKTYNGGEVGRLTYTATYTPSGSLLIHPEAYKQYQALPLSDFVLVDGKLGSNEVWKSNIDSSSFKVTKETLLPWQINPSSNYANAGEYPAVFKTTAHAANISDSSIGVKLTETFSDEKWIVPTKDNTEVKDDKIYVANHVVDGTIYYNGGKEKPNNGYYQISVDIKINEEKKILPVMGLQLNTVEIGGGIGDAKTASASNVDKIEKDDETNTYTVTLKNVEGQRYGYGTTKDDIKWQDSHVIVGLEEKTYYFYTYTPASIDEDGNFHAASDAVYSGCIYQLEEASKIEKDKKYLLASGDAENGYNVAYVKKTTGWGSTNYTLAVTSIQPQEGFMTAEPNTLSQHLWVTEQDEDQNWVLKDKTYSRYLKLDITREGTSFIKYTSRICEPVSEENAIEHIDLIAETNFKIWDSVTYRDLLQEKTEFAFLSISSTAVEFKETESTIKFLRIPTLNAPAVNAPSVNYDLGESLTMTQSVNVFKFVQSKLPENVTLEKLYLNSAENNNPKTGVYSIKVVTNEGAANISATLTVQKRNLDDTIVTTIDVTRPDENDDQKITIKANNLHDNGGNVYIGYKTEGETTYHWFPAGEENSYTFRLHYGKYVFAVKETGSLNFNGSLTEREVFSLSPLPLELSIDIRAQFVYTIDGTGNVTWYNKLPSKVNMDRIHMYYGVADGDKNISWSQTYSDKVSYYGIYMENVTYQTSDDQEKTYLHNVGDKTILQLTPPVNITSANGHTSSMMRGQSLYFMGTGNSINTYGNSIFLTTDLLVLNSGIADGSIFVQPYTAADERITPTLLFNASENDIKVGSNTLAGRTFYAVDTYTDICNDPLEMLCNINGKSDNYTKIQYQMRKKMIPELNLDIAYANATQLSHIISGETIGWTEKGVLSGSNSSTNAAYAVCAYVSEISGSVDYKANRVLIAANTGTSYTLSVPADLTFTTRYLSVDADQIVQGSSGVKFTLKNLGLDESFLTWLNETIKVAPYRSKTLQMDYERSTQMITVDTSPVTVKAQICRYEDGANLFTAEQLPLIATYNTDEIESMGNKFKSVSKTVDRYVSIVGTENNQKIDFSSLFDKDYKLYANYVYLNLKEIDMRSITGTANIYIGCQENGYEDAEYMGLFSKYSTETYNGTLLYFAQQTTLYYGSYFSWGGSSVKIEPGFYYISPREDTEVCITALMDEDSDGNYLYKIDPATLKDYSIYIDENGNISDAYVDTGIYDNNIVGDGGFSGGKVQ